MNPYLSKKPVDKDHFIRIMRERFGLRPDWNTSCQYIDTFPENQKFYNKKFPKVFTMDWVDSTGHGWANIHSKYYDEHTKPKTDLHKEMLEFKDNHTFKHNNYWYQ